METLSEFLMGVGHLSSARSSLCRGNMIQGWISARLKGVLGDSGWWWRWRGGWVGSNTTQPLAGETPATGLRPRIAGSYTRELGFFTLIFHRNTNTLCHVRNSFVKNSHISFTLQQVYNPTTLSHIVFVCEKYSDILFTLQLSTVPDGLSHDT